RKNPKAPAALDPLLWVAANGNAFSPRFEQLRASAVALLLEYHLDSEQLGPACQRWGPLPSTIIAKLLREILVNTPHHQVRVQACFFLAQHLTTLAEHDRQLREEQQGTFRRFVGRLSRTFRAYIERSDPNQLDNKAAHLLDWVLGE